MRWLSRSVMLVVALTLGCGGRVGAVEAVDSGVPETDAREPWDVAAPDMGTPTLLMDLELVPGSEVVFIDESGGVPKPATLAYRAILRREDGTSEDVTSSTTFTLGDATLGSFSGALFTSVADLPGTASPRGVATFVHAERGSTRGSANLAIVQLDRSRDAFFVVPYNDLPDPLRAVIRMTAGSTVQDLVARPTVEPSPDGVDATVFVRVVRAMSEGDKGLGCAPRTARDEDGDGITDTFAAVEPGASVCFEVVAKMNTTIKWKGVTRFYGAFLDLYGLPGATMIERHRLIFMVPQSYALGGK